MDEIQNGAIAVGETDQDFLITGETYLPEIEIQDEIRYEYNQGNTPHCTVYASLGTLSDLFNRVFSSEEIDSCLQYCFENGKPVNDGWETKLAVQYVTKRWNINNPSQQVMYSRGTITTDLYNNAIKNNYTVVCTYKGNHEYNVDFSDASLDGIKFPDPTYGHCVCQLKKDGLLCVKDNYKGRTGKNGIYTNYYKVKDIQGLINNNVFYPACYIITQVPVDKEGEKKRLLSMQNEINTNISNNSSLRHETNDQSFRNRLHETNNVYRKKLEDIENELKKYN